VVNNDLERYLEKSSHAPVMALPQHVPAGIEENQEQHVRFAGVPAKIQTGHHVSTSLKKYHVIIKYNAATGSKYPGKYEDYSVDLISTPAFGRKLFHLS
jgi:hypothetical protein